MKMMCIFLVLFCGLWSQCIVAEEGSCKVNDMRVLILTVKQLKAELRENKELKLALQTELKELRKAFNELNSDTSSIKNETKELQKSQKSTTAVDELNITLYNHISNLNTFLNEMGQMANTSENQASQLIEINTTVQADAAQISKLHTTVQITVAQICDINTTVQTAVAQLRDINTTVQATTTQISDINATIQAKTGQIEMFKKVLQDSVTEMKVAIGEHTADIQQTLEKFNTFIEVQMDVLNSFVGRIHQGLVSIVEEVNATLQSQTSVLETLMISKAMDTNHSVGFVAKSNRHQFTCEGTLLFETILLNIDEVYNNNTGYFTAPFSAMYLFSVQICSEAVVVFSLTSPTKGNLSQTLFDDFYRVTCSSVTTVAHLSKGEQVFVNCTYPSLLSGTYGNRYWTMFSGVMIP